MPSNIAFISVRLFTRQFLLLKQTTQCLIMLKHILLLTWDPYKIYLKCKFVESKQLRAAFPHSADTREWNFIVHVNSGVTLHCLGHYSYRIESGPKLNALNRVLNSVKKNSIFIFIFNCVLFKKLEEGRLMT
jgi:hypothetical protein